MKNDLFNDRISRFSIRKLNVGVCSVLLGTLVMLGTATGVAAEEVAENKQTDEVAVTTEKEQPESLSTSQAEKEDATTYQANPVVPVATETKLELDQTRLQAYIAEIETNLTNGKYSNKTDESVEILKVALANAKNALTSATSQAELDTAYQSLATIVNDKLKEKEVPTKPTAAEEKIAAGAEAPASEDAPKRRSRRAVGDPNDESLIGDDVEDATSTPKVEKPTGWSSIDAKELVKQVNWLDFGDTAAWSNTTTSKDGRTALQVGSTFTKEIMPGYVINIKVKSLKPFQATELYKKRMEKQGATEEEKATYDPNAKNGYIGTISDPKTRAAFANNEEALVVADAQNGWTEIRKEGINTGTKRTTISSDYNGGNIGIQFEISATFRGKKVKPAVVAADGESANPGELVMFTTNGVGWEYVGEWKKNTNSVNYAVQDTKDYFDPANGYGRTKPISVEGTNITGLNLQLLRDAKEVGPDKKPVAWKYFGNPDQVTGGLGTGIFGPNVSASNFSVPIVMTRSASEIGLYIASSGKQSAMLGFFPLDEGDAPESYGKAIHSIGTVDGVTGAKLSQPYLGNVSPDMDENTPLDWFGDDNTTTADEGINQLLPEELKGTTNEMIKMDRTKPGNYKMSVQAHLYWTKIKKHLIIVVMKLTNEETQKIEQLLKDSSYAKYHKRLQIIYFRSKEKSYKEIMDLLDCNKTTVWRNLKKYKEFGLEALLQETRGGRHREYMTYEEEQAFLKRHIEAAQAGEFVTVNQLFEAYQKEIGRTSTRDGFYYLLKRHGWRTVTPRPEHPKKADAQTIETSKNKIYIRDLK